MKKNGTLDLTEGMVKERKKPYETPAYEKKDLFEKFATPGLNRVDSGGCSYCSPGVVRKK